MTILEITLFITIMLVLFPFVAFKLAGRDLFFTRMESGDIKFIMRGETLHRIINDTPGKEIVGGMEKSWFNKKFGLYWIGIPPFGKVHRFSILKERENPRGTGPEDWIIREKEETPVFSLRFTFPRPFVLPQVELGDRLPVDVLVVAKFEVVNPHILVFYFKGRFFENAGSIIRAAVSDVLKELNIEQFIAADKGEVNGILKQAGMKDEDGLLNTELIKQVGLRLVGISIPQYDPSDKEVRLALNAQAIALKKGQAEVVVAEQHAKQLAIRAEADAKAIERLAAARGVHVSAVVNALASRSDVSRDAAGVLRAESFAGPDSKITTLVDGNAAPAVIPVGEKK